MGLEVSAESALAAGGVMGIMIIPFISSLSDDVITSVPQSLRDGSYAMGATKSETIKRVIFPSGIAEDSWIYFTWCFKSYWRNNDSCYSLLQLLI